MEADMGILVDHPLTGIGAGISRLSELEIDADKDWVGYGITNIVYLAAGAAKGDMPIEDIMTNLTPGTIGKPLTSQGPGVLPTWG
jgi:hypothetical protein